MSYFKSAEQYYKEMTSTLKDVDTSEHSLIYNANMPISMELSYNTMLLDELEKQIHAKSALESGYYDSLVKICADMGIERKSATTADGMVTITGAQGITIPKGFAVATKLGITYKTTIQTTIPTAGTIDVYVKADGTGASYNVEVGDICTFPVSYKGIDTVTNNEAITNGYDIESYESLYNRYLLKIQKPSTSGNKYHYEQWALDVVGVGNATCIPSAGLVTVIITDSNKRKANDELVQKTYDYIDEVRPLLAGELVVKSVKEVEMTITGLVEIDASVNLGDVQNAFATLIEEYFDDKVYKTKRISIAKIQALLIDINGVLDCTNIKINGSYNNIELNVDEIAILKNVDIDNLLIPQ
ncbi:baseplate J/gp47 family protein [Clostridium butyricum]|uniref:Baseplate J family protein n=1 Tax=Clostridium butyricum E4 str. BoNT E BL5262 TaxID=632245 RepID=C4IKA4_CLOBU|nr:baseplate J/gp47 family protein [Clostridium butyricum]EDT75135.1 putative conserved hypothetical protein [Clostridium butyricum 5521]EEP54298.1 baseplate J family protein [Clostridium butyricum E4 str. BoNT E BL5262]NFL32919.1 baseplate J/gp47 family protein [Clostridium butyricum]NFS20265.1 baseplate J/gp47 family protein [Clostridium butyricum]